MISLIVFLLITQVLLSFCKDPSDFTEEMSSLASIKIFTIITWCSLLFTKLSFSLILLQLYFLHLIRFSLFLKLSMLRRFLMTLSLLLITKPLSYDSWLLHWLLLTYLTSIDYSLPFKLFPLSTWDIVEGLKPNWD